MNLVKEAVEHLNPNQTPVLTMDQPLFAIGKEIQWLWPDPFSNNKCVIMTEMAGRVVEWFWVAKGKHNCWNSVAESFVKTSYLVRTRHAQQVTAEALHILQQTAFFMCSLSLIMLSAPNSDKHRLETEQPQFKYWAVVLEFQLCVLRLVR